MEREKTILAILFEIKKDIKALKKHLGVKKEKEEKEEEKEEEEKKKTSSPLDLYPTAEEILKRYDIKKEKNQN